MSVSDTNYTARFFLPELIERGRTNLLKCPVYHNGALVAPNSGTVSVYNASNTAVVSGASVTISSSVAQYSLSSGTVSSESYGEGWRVEWVLVMPDSTTRTFRNDAALIRSALSPVITDTDISQRCSALDPASSSVITSKSNYQAYLDEAWIAIQGRLIGKGNRPYLVMSPSALRECHLNLTLALIFEDLASRNPAQAERATAYRQHYEKAWAELNFLYDSSDSGQADSARRRRAANPTLWLGTPNPSQGGWPCP